MINDLTNIPTTEPERQEYFMAKCQEIMAANGKKYTFHVSTFGCQMNAHDSEKLIGILEKIGFSETDEEEKADFVIYNTCTVRENANQKLYGHLGQLKKKKEANPDMMIGICGCMMQQPETVDYIQKSFRFVDLLFGTFNFYKLAELLYQRMTSEDKTTVCEVLEAPKVHVEKLPEHRKFKYKSGVNIMFGCNNFCSYCIVPYVRGRERSRTPEEILEEVKNLVADGCVEIMLLGQNVNSYGVNYMSESEMIKANPDYDFPDLMEDVCKIEGLKRVRFMTSHPKDLSDKLIEVIKRNPKVCRHIHLPVQSGSTNVLKAMNRHYTKEQYLDLVAKIRKELPDVSLTTDIMVGFPGETEEDFQETMDVVSKAGYDQVFTFIYSMRTGTPAAKMEQLDQKVVNERFSRLLKLVHETSSKTTARFQGQVKEILVESVNDHIEGYMTGRMTNNILVHFPGTEDMIGTFVNVKLNEAKGFYYIGEIAE